jgi:hypothetical protein
VVAALIALALAVPAPTHDTLPVYVDQGSGGGFFVEFTTTWGARQLKLPAQLRAFRRARGIQDLLPAPLLQRAQFFAVTGLGLEPRHSRLLLADGRIRIYGIPTRRGQLCAFVVPTESTDCTAVLLHGAWPKVEPRLVVWGVVDDRATRVDLRFATGTLRAALGTNAFYLGMPRGEVAPRSIVVTDRGGARHVYTIERCHVADFGDQVALPSGPLDPPPGC